MGMQLIILNFKKTLKDKVTITIQTPNGQFVIQIHLKNTQKGLMEFQYQ